MNRRQFVVGSAATMAWTRWAHAAEAAAASGLEVEAPCGALRGELREGVRVFRGVPFAEPPVGRLRFHPPRRMKRWSGVREATKFAAAPVQPDAKEVAQSEDCLYLNVWAPENVSKPLPVFVWIHGGGFTGGYSFESMYDGAGFARDGVVCVTIAYRLGALGFLDMAPLLGGSYAGSANNALRDVIAALEWVQRNIAAFGGDPQRVTVGGESAGAKLTDLLMGVPEAEPLFAQMISESGGAERIWPRPRAEEIARGFGAMWSAKKGRTIGELKDADPHAIIEVQQRLMREWPAHFPLRAEIDGKLIRQAPLMTIREGSTHGKRLLLGTNRDESAMFLGPHPAKDPAAKDLGNMTVEEFRPIAQRYAEFYPEMDPETRRIRSVTAEEYWLPSVRVAEAHVTGGGTAFVYRLDYREPGGRYPGLAFHSLDVRFVWEHLAKVNVSDDDRRFARAVHRAWVAFIKGEAPQADGLPEWPEYTLKTRSTMLLDRVSRVQDGPQAEELAAWRGKLE